MNEKIRIAYFITSLESGGTERQLALLLENLPSQRYEKHVVCLSGYGPLLERFQACTDTVYDINYPRLRHNGKIIWKNLPSAVTSVFRLARLLRRIRPDILHTLIPVCNVMGAFAAKLARVPVLVSSRLSLGNYRDSNRLFARLEDFTDRYFALIHCKSHGIEDDVLRREPVDPDRLKVIYNGYRFDDSLRMFDKEPLRQSLGIALGIPVIGMVANLKPYKGHEDLLNSIPIILKKHPNARFLFIGRDDGILTELQELAEKLHISRHIIWAGERNDVPRLLTLMTLLVSASHEEGFSNSIVEAMAAALPVVATDVGGNKEQVADRITGYLVPPRSSKELAQAVIELLDDEERAKKMGRHGYYRAAQNFSIQKVVEQTEAFYKEAIELATE